MSLHLNTLFCLIVSLKPVGIHQISTVKVVQAVNIESWLLSLHGHHFCSVKADTPFFPNHSIRQVPIFLFIQFFKSSWRKICSAARNLINSVTQIAATTFAFYSVFILLLLYGGEVSFSTLRWIDF